MILNSPYISGSLTVTGNTTIQGQLTVTGSLSGTASLASNALLLQGTGSTGFATTASINEVSASQQSISASLLQVSASYIALSASYNTFSGSASTRITENSSSIQQVSASQQQISASYIALSASYNTFSGSASTRTTQIEQVYATTGSNSFRADQSITGSLTVTGQIIAQTLNVQQVTSSIIYSSGSNIFGCDLNSRQTFTGSVNITGSQTVFGNVGINAGRLTISASSDSVGQYYYMSAKGETNVGFSIYEYSGNQYINASGSMILRYNNMGSTTGVFMIASGSSEILRISAAGNMGIGTTTPDSLLEVQNCINLSYLNTNTLTSGQWLRISNQSSCTGATSGILFQAQGPGGGNGIATINAITVSCGSMTLAFGTRNSSGNVEEKMRILSSGTVAIGTQTQTPTPHAGVSVGGLIVQGLAGCRGLIEVWDASCGKAVFQQVGGTTYIGNLYKGASGGDLQFLVNGSGTSATEAMVITCQGRVLINNTAQNNCADYSRVTISGAYAKTNTCTSFLSSVLHLTTCENDYPFGMKFFMGGDTCSTNRYVSIQTGDHNISNEGNIIFQPSGGKVGIGPGAPNRTFYLCGDSSLLGNNYLASNKMIQWEGGNYWSIRTSSSAVNFEIYRGDNGTTPLAISPSGTISTFGNFSGGNYYTMDTYPSYCLLAAGQCIHFCTMSGMVLVNDHNDGSVTMYLAGGGSTTTIGCVIAKTGCLWYNGNINGYTWSNTSGATRSYGFFVVRTRANA